MQFQCLIQSSAFRVGNSSIFNMAELTDSTVTKIGVLFENISSLAKTTCRTSATPVTKVSDSKEPVWLRYWLIKPVELPGKMSNQASLGVLHGQEALDSNI